MKNELGFGWCGLACCLCSQNDHCRGCTSGDCPAAQRCENIRCCKEKDLEGCADCQDMACRKGLLAKSKAYGFTTFIRRYGARELLACLERNEAAGISYHRQGYIGDYDGFTDMDALIRFIQTGKKN